MCVCMCVCVCGGGGVCIIMQLKKAGEKPGNTRLCVLVIRTDVVCESL